MEPNPPFSTSSTRSSKKRRQSLLLLVALATLVAAGTTMVIAYLRRDAAPQNTTISRDKTIALKESWRDMHITPNGQISGTYQAAKDQALFYSVAASNNKLVGGGTILSDQSGKFSRNLAFTEEVADNTPLTLRIYVQDKQGTIKDELSLQTIYRKS